VTERERAQPVSLLYAFVLAIVFATALGVRVWGLHWSLPKSGGFSFHPDEIFQIAAAMRIDFLNGRFNPGFYNYGAMYLYLVSLATTLGTGFGLVDPAGLADRYMAGRIISAVLGAATVYLVYLAAVRLYGEPTGLIAAAFAAVAPIAVVHSHFATVDSAAGFWVAACLAASAALSREPSLKLCALAGLFAGFAGATKYTAAIVLVAPLVGVFVGPRNGPVQAGQSPKRVAMVVGMAALGFLIGNPGAVLWPGEFLRGFLYEYHHAGAGHGLVFAGTGSGWMFHLKSSLRFGLGAPLLILGLAGVAAMAADRSRRGWGTLAFAASYYLLIGFAQVRFARYVIPLIPALSVASAFAVTDIHRRLGGIRNPGAARAARCLWVTGCCAAVYYTLSYCVALDRRFTLADPREEAAAWVERHAPTGVVIALPTAPWFYSPAFRPEFTHFRREKAVAALAEIKEYKLVTNAQTPWDAHLLRSSGADYVIISDYESQDAERTRDTDATDYMRLVNGRYAPVSVSAAPLRWGGLDFGPTRRLPHDMKYAAPTLTVYRRRT